MKRAIVTGATGFLGFALLKELIQNGVYVYALCRKNSKRILRLNGLSNVEVIEVDMNCLEPINRLGGCDVFYHLAWGGGRYDFEGQYENIQQSINCLKLASELGCKRFICTGSQAEFGNTAGPITEETALEPTNAYGACKVAAYYLTAELAAQLNIEHTWARIFSVYGPSDTQNTLIVKLLNELGSTGEAWLSTDGGHIWNYLHEEDAARALYLLGVIQNSNTVYNVASRECKPLKEFVEDLRKAFGETVMVHYGAEKSSINLNVFPEKLINTAGEYENHSFAKSIKDMVSHSE